MKQLLLISGVVLTTLFSCKKSSPIEDPILQKYTAPENVEPYVKRFEYEGRKRGFIVDVHTSNIQISFGSAVNGNAAVTYLQTSKIVIDSVYWKSGLIDLEKERVIFHELGHCYLKRNHLNSVFASYKAEYTSMMLGGFSPFPTIDKFYYFDAPRERHDYYVDELFDPLTARPYWSF